MSETLQLLKRTVTPGAAPDNILLPGQLAVSVTEPVKLWVGVDTAVDPLQHKLLVDTSAVTGGITEPVGFGTWGRLETGAWARAVSTSGDSINGELYINSPREQALVVTGDIVVNESILGSGLDGRLFIYGAIRSYSLFESLFDGSLTVIGNTTSAAFIATSTNPVPELNRATVGLDTVGDLRWRVNLGDMTVPAGGSTGHDFAIYSYADGTTLQNVSMIKDIPLSINRASSVVNFTQPPTVNGVPVTMELENQVKDLERRLTNLELSIPKN
jgi:hypothetical protein